MNEYTLKFNNKNLKYYLRDDVDFSVFNEIFKIREYKVADNVLKNAKYPIIDIGAHVGFFSIYAACLNENVNILAIEPEKNNFEMLEKHKNVNIFTKIKTYKCAIGNKTKKGKILIKEDSINHKIFKEKEEGILQETMIFNFIDFLDKNNIDKVSLIKMDIEGGEYDIFESLKENDFLRIGSIIMEYHVLDKKRDERYIEELLRKNGFSVQNFPSKFEKDLGFIFAINKRKY